ncbi:MULTISPECIES: hypothetical protein [Paraburkholderia]|jgi:uncharacterized membrane protein|uniref:Uncharacterized membrane protein n=2 Tax=Paraburkholderia TaxID=1822464 RepID=A0A1I7E7I7_9BURK|nr:MULTISPECIES: hypothetical protein [Paraburkholderia]KPD18587.1 membrane protein [Burkholderia sp. ST111]MBK5149504.1 DUF4126 domain-containing protein [Burkholderia sp. R-69608]MBK3740846.1 DUF4126 domain-containing protein [Paraburkholderia aspalathi]MBK3783051.1 DUF4126 domain-containing protein [Paraburkholderia aspalathi]MBK3813104.1 DUF4126 domain-containing protein [Paraburkholderia aspalathi]
MPLYVVALLIGVVAGLRAMTAPAAISWAAHLGWLPLQDTPLAFLGFAATPYIFTVLAIVELITDQLPKTPSRTVPMQFGARIVLGGLSGAAIGAAHGGLVGGLIAGVVGAVIGTLGGARVRAALARTFGRDLPAALIEDAVAIVGAVVIVMALR